MVADILLIWENNINYTPVGMLLKMLAEYIKYTMAKFYTSSRTRKASGVKSPHIVVTEADINPAITYT